MEQDNKDILVKVEGLSKKFCKDLKTSLWYGVKDLTAEMLGHPYSAVLRPKEFWAVKGVSFELRRGECLGLIGHNGAGKSTLLKILNGLINPDDGKVTIKGRVGALIELGAGFNPILSGRENIYNNGAILGFSRKEIDAKLDEIIAFAELEDFIDMPVQHYSSGMKVRLGFAVAAQMEPDVLLVDEVLAVGDLGFIMKCFKTIDELLPKTAIIFVSHSMPLVSRVCNKILLLDHGKTLFKGKDTSKGIDIYYSQFKGNGTSIIFSNGLFELKKVGLVGADLKDTELPKVKWNTEFKLFFKFKVNQDINFNPIFRIIILDKELREVAVLEENESNGGLNILDGVSEFTVSHEYLELSKGIYSIDILVAKNKTRSPLLRQNNIMRFQVLHDKETWPPFLLKAKFENLKTNEIQ
ncbi:ABC transporter ATP-binding protein [Mangrovimonas sp. YM274]|uniref:ABC transporter ATP-binding protein n=1 Tax=Mangrovimonas sp. YM274 TaxID=3070660 RepID=UPI0027DB99BA|nr:ABC transporter ATP-binding protein [Mangrovimonas sp. YM274]WMI69836.1 ABC transporter ATP-binding protein [Mangrovimonas sp. YM274]